MGLMLRVVALVLISQSVSAASAYQRTTWYTSAIGPQCGGSIREERVELVGTGGVFSCTPTICNNPWTHCEDTLWEAPAGYYVTDTYVDSTGGPCTGVIESRIARQAKASPTSAPALCHSFGVTSDKYYCNSNIEDIYSSTDCSDTPASFPLMLGCGGGGTRYSYCSPCGTRAGCTNPPTASPTAVPSKAPTTGAPSRAPSQSPSKAPSVATTASVTTLAATGGPTGSPTAGATSGAQMLAVSLALHVLLAIVVH